MSEYFTQSGKFHYYQSNNNIDDKLIGGYEDLKIWALRDAGD